MKKITFLLTLLLSFVGVGSAWAAVGDVITDLNQLSADKVYSFTAERGTLSSGTSKIEKVNAVSGTRQYFRVESAGSDGLYYIYSVRGKGYWNGSLNYETTQATKFKIVSTSNATNPWMFKNEGATSTLNINGAGNPVMDSWSTADGGNCFKFTEAGDFADMEQTMLNEDLAEACASAKSTLDAYSSRIGVPFSCTQDAWNTLNTVYEQYKSTTTATQDNIDAVKAALTTFGSSAANTTITDGSKFIIGNKLHTGLFMFAKEINRVNATGGWLGAGATKDSYRYMFTIKSNGDGKYKLYNDYYNKYIGAVPTVNDREYQLVDEANATTFTLDATSLDYCNIYDATCTYKAGNNTVNALHMVNWSNNPAGNGVVRWTSDADASSFKLYPVTDDITTAWDNAIKAKANAAVTHAGTAIGEFNAEPINAALATFNAATTVTEKAQAYKALEEAILSARVTPDPNKYYTICNATNTDKLIAENYSNKTSGNESKLYATEAGTNIVPALWKIQPITAAGYTDLFSIIAANSGSYMSKTVYNYTMHVTTASNGNVGRFDLFTKDVVNKDHAVSLVTYTNFDRTDRGTVSLKADYTEINSWNAADQNNNFLIQEATEIPVHITSAGYATLNLPFAVTIASGVKAYTATDGDTEISLTEVEGGAIPANTPVILVANEGNYTFAIDYDNTASAISSALNGTLVPTAVAADATAYILKNGTSGIGMYKITSDTDRTIGANKAYMGSTTASSEAAMKAFNFGTVEGINHIGINTEAENAAYYDLNGRRVLFPAHGVFVKGNGQKVYIK